MTTRVVLLPIALADAVEARWWYEDQREGLGSEFEVELDAALELMRRYPLAQPAIVGDVRRRLMGRFPYGIFYQMIDERLILVVGIFHASHEPGALPDRIN